MQNIWDPNRYTQKWVFALIDEVKKYTSLWKHPMELERELEKPMADMVKITKNLTIKFGKSYTPTETFNKWVELKKQFFFHHNPDSPVHQKLRFLNRKKNVAMMEMPKTSKEDEGNGPIFYDMPDLTSTAPSTQPTFKIPVVPKKYKDAPVSENPACSTVSPISEQPIVINLEEEFDPPNIGEVVCTGMAQGPPTYERYQGPYYGGMADGRSYHPYYQPPIMSQKRRRQLAQNPETQQFPLYMTPIQYYPGFSMSNQANTPSKGPESLDFEDFDPEKAAEQLFFSKKEVIQID